MQGHEESSSADSPQPGSDAPAASRSPTPTLQPGELTAKAGRPPRTRTSAAFKGFAAGAVVLLLLLIFILENTQRVKVSYFGATGHVALGVALLLAAVGGALLVAAVGAARISQLRRHARRQQPPRQS